MWFSSPTRCQLRKAFLKAELLPLSKQITKPKQHHPPPTTKTKQHQQNQSWLFHLVQTSLEVSLWPLYFHCLTFSNLEEKLTLFVMFPNPKDFKVLLSIHHRCHLMAPKPTERSWVVKWGCGRRASLQGAGSCLPGQALPAYFQHPSSTWGHREAIWISPHQVHSRAIQKASTSTSPELKWCWISVKWVHITSLCGWNLWPVRSC